MYKRKRKSAESTPSMSTTEGFKRPAATRRRNPEDEDDDVIIIDSLDSEGENQNGGSSSKKKRVDADKSTNAGKGAPSPKSFNQKALKTVQPSSNLPPTTNKAGNNNGKDKESGGSGVVGDKPGPSTSACFKVPDVPMRRPKGPEPVASTSKAETAAISASQQKVINESMRKRKKVKPTDQQLKSTGESRQLRKAFIDVLQDAICPKEPLQEPNESPIENILAGLDSCITGRLYTFTTRRLPEGPKFEDVSKDSEVEEFARWWLFGVTALLFSRPEQEARKNFLKAKSVLASLCQLLLCGHPAIVDRIGVEFFQLLKDLLVRSENQVPILKLSLSRPHADSDGNKVFKHDVQLTENNEWIIPHYIQAVSPLITRICLHNVKLFHLFNDTLRRLLTKLTTPETVETVLASFPSFALTDAHSCYLTENTFCSIFQKILEAPTLSKIDVAKIRHLFSQYDLQNRQFAGFLQDSGMGLLQMGIKDFLYSDKFALLSKNDLNGVIVQAFKFIIEGSQRSASWTAAEVIPLTRLVSTKGLETILHPLLEQLILSELLSYDYCGEEPLKPRRASKVWNSIFQVWEDSLTLEYRALLTRPGENANPEEVQLATISFFSNTATLTKLVSRLRVQLRQIGVKNRIEFFELKHLQRWSDITFQSLANGQKLNPTKLPQLYSSILDTLQNLDSCNWFGTTLSTKFLNSLICIPGWLWLSQYDGYIPQKLKPLPVFTRKWSDLQFIRGSSLLTSKAVGTLRLEVFRPWRCFVAEIYISIMEAPTTLKDPFLVMEILCAMSAVSWVFKEAIPLKRTFIFLDKLIRTDLWKGYSGVRSSLALAITALPCICHYNYLRSRSSNKIPLVSRSGCEKEKCQTFVLLPPEVLDERPNEDEDLNDGYIKTIVQLVLPLLKSKFLLLKITLSDLIISCHNHVQAPSASIIIPMIEVAVHGHTILCEEIFRKVGLIVASAVPNSLDANNANGVDTEIAQKIFSSAIPELCKRKLATSNKRILSLRTREKIIKGVVTFSTVGPMNMSIFVEILKCIIPIVSQIRGNENSVTILSQKIVTHFAEVHNCQPHELMTRVRYEISKCIVNCALKAFCLESGQEERRVLMCVKFIERLKYIGKFRLAFVRYFYPPLMELIVPKLTESRYQFLLSCLASHEKVTELTMLQEYIMNYFPTLLLDHPSETITKCLKFLKTFYGFEAMIAAQHQEQRILNEALCRLGDREDKVLRFLSHLCKWDEHSSRLVANHGTASKIPRSELQELLSKRLLGFFIHLDTKLQSRIETVETKQNILKSFTVLMRLMGKSKITPVKSKVYKTLYSTTKEGSQYHEVLYDAWKEFANNLDSSSFSAMTPQILASILPLRETFEMRSKVDRLISHFVCFKKDLTAAHHQELYFLLDQCEDPEVIQTIRLAVDKMKTNNWADYVNMIVREASNENPPIRFEAFRKLRDVFKFDWELIEKFVLVKGRQYVSQMISTLLTGLRGTGNTEDEKLRAIIIDCFGCIGALDPVRFRSVDDDGNSKNSLSTSLAISCQMNTFIVLYLGELIREFQEVKDTTNFDYCACLIQIVLKEFKVNSKDENDKIWKYLSKEQQETISPMLNTKYQMDSKNDVPKMGCPIYLSEHGESFEKWLINWMCVLITYITDQEPQAYSLFSKSMNVLKTNVRIATFIIPFVAMYAIFCATREQRSNIVIEIKTILERWVILDEMKQKAHSIVPIKDSEVENGMREEPLSVENESIFHARCTQVIFSILDHLLRSSSLARRKLGLKRATEMGHRRPDPRGAMTNLPMSESGLRAVESVLHKIPPLLISEVACNCGSFPAALYYLEQDLKYNKTEENLQSNVDYLQRLYICLDDMDSVCGMGSVRTRDPSFAGQILENIVNGKTQESVKSLEQKAIRDTDDFQLHQALVRAYLKVEEPHAAETVINATLVRQPEWEIDLQEVHMEALLRLQKWPELNAKVDGLEEMKGNQYLEEKFLTWNVAIPRIMSKLQRNQTEAAVEVLTELKTGLIAPLVATCEEMYPYKRAYPHIVQLHILTEIDDATKLLRKYANSVVTGRSGSTQGWVHKEVTRLVNKWETRLWNVSRSRKMTDQILNVRKNIFQIMKTTFSSNPQTSEVLNSCIRECWLDIARDASKCGDFVRADNCLREAKEFMSPKVVIEEAKILNRKGEKENAIAVLRKGIQAYFPQREVWKNEGPTTVLKPSVLVSGNAFETVTALLDSKLLCSKALLLLAKLCEEQKLFDMEDYIGKYKEAADVYKESEKNFFTLGSYYDRLWTAADKTQHQYFEVQAMVVRYYSQSLHYGCKYVYQSLPRLLSIWFDFAAGLQTGEFTKCANLPPTAPSTSSSSGSGDSSTSSNRLSPGPPGTYLDMMNASISRMSTAVPAYVLMTAFTQLVSRLCHSHTPTWTLLKEIIVRIICAHPYQTLWMTMTVYKSVNSMRRRRCLEIYKNVEKRNIQLKETIKDYTNLTEKFIDLCNKVIPRDETKASLAKIYDKLPKLIRQMGPGRVAVPFQVFMNPSLPRKGVSHKDHNPYPESLVFIDGIEDTVDVMHSLIRPKKITLRATNGKSYGLMCKPKDDLRKDSKVMEVNNVVNWYLSQNSDSSQRRLHVRTYSVVALNEECGLLEWVPNLTTFRQVLNSLYKEKNILPFRGPSRINLHEHLDVKKAKFIEIMLKQTPPVFSDWFFNQFNDHQSWYTARMSYVRTAAVISIVGYIMGLGDRHCENILLDTVTGEVVHVDFNCLFNKGETFEWAERVPFRLTQNMVDGMGPLGYEGVFRKSCEIVMNMFREHKSIFLSVLRPFVFDPLVEWQKKDKVVVATLEAGELTNDKAVETMKYIRHRLNGTARNMMKDINTERSVKAHVNYLIQEATSIENLCQMWVGWAAFM